MIRCPSCNSHMSCRMGYDCGVPIVIYSCDNCRYTTFSEAYITNSKIINSTFGSDITKGELKWV